MDPGLNRFSFPEIRKLFTSKIKVLSQGRAETLLDILLSDLLHLTPGGSIVLLSDMEIERMEMAIKQVNEGFPIQYVTGLAHFYGHRFQVNPNVLIPRSETEELVDLVLKEIKPLFSPIEVQILDIGTGSGCIALSLKKKWLQAQITGIDISREAIEIAKINARNLEVKITFETDDVFNPTGDKLRNGKWDVIVSNPPYISFSELAQMDEHVQMHEPHVALFPPGGDVAAMYQAIFEYASSHLNKPGYLVVELNEFRAGEILDLMSHYPLKEAVIIYDMQGKERIMKARKE